ncbi:hypothetical protein SAMN05444161_3876 [Rhizobiales bacterium GAS191]|nr:hypothetical protein SAMN05444161_3876 [Rhizobiales bacterium GAS191]
MLLSVWGQCNRHPTQAVFMALGCLWDAFTLG